MQTIWSMKKASQCNIPLKLKYHKCVYIKNSFQAIPIKLSMCRKPHLVERFLRIFIATKALLANHLL